MQRTTRASVRVDGEAVGRIERGLVVFLGVGPGDSEATAQHLAGRIATLRVFADAAGRMNLDVGQSGGSVLLISQFTLYADTSRGHRPSFIGAAPPPVASELFNLFAYALRERGLNVETGRFGTHMDVEMVNDGPVTLAVSSGERAWGTDAG